MKSRSINANGKASRGSGGDDSQDAFQMAVGSGGETPQRRLNFSAANL